MLQKLKPYFRDATILFTLIGVPLIALVGVFGLSIDAEKVVPMCIVFGMIQVINASSRISKNNRKIAAGHLSQ
ncbi:hypothetical protein G6L37_07195 [Agrobacterium rubi]|nr:hypothetical protein [Agrobacterium rubi]NTF25152.1 hypothetical protein [Agrobacterium rubi]